MTTPSRPDLDVPTARPAGAYARSRARGLRLLLCSALICGLLASVTIGFAWPSPRPAAPPQSVYLPMAATYSSPERSLRVLVDDFAPGGGAPANRLGGDYGAANGSSLRRGDGLMSATVAPGQTWGGAWTSLNHPAREGLPLDFAATLPPQILPAYQSRITGLSVAIARGAPGRLLRLELKDRGALRWQHALTLEGGPQAVGVALPTGLRANELVWVLDRAAPGESVVLDSVAFTVTTPLRDIATAAFVWSYAMLLSNWSPTTGLVRDKATGASGEFDAIQATGSLAAATAVAAQLGVVGRSEAIRVVSQISDTLLLDTPRFQGLWPHFATVDAGGTIAIAPGTEWSSVDTVIAAVGLLAAQGALGLDTSGAEELLQGIAWDDLQQLGMVAHGYAYTGERLGSTWDVFGGESWLVDLAYAGATGQVAPLAFPGPPTANGSGFIDELAWLFFTPPTGPDYWGDDWAAYRQAAAAGQVAYYPDRHPESCLSRLGLFGLSAAEVPDPAHAPEGAYQAFGVGGQFAAANDGSALLGAPVFVPHYVAITASLRPRESLRQWGWLIDGGLFSPLTNVESALFPAGATCRASDVEWNQLKGSWNLALQTLGWGRYLAERGGQVPALWQATATSPLLLRGYRLITEEPADRAASKIAVLPGPGLPSTRAYHTATRLADGRILTVGGSRVTDAVLAEAAIFDPASGAINAVAPLHTERGGHSATLLVDGRVLVVGGYNRSQQWLDDAELYDPAADRWTVVPPLFAHGVAHTATLLKDGRVLVVGGCTGSWVCNGRTEIFDPKTNTWQAAAPLGGERSSHMALRLDDGRVLVIGGWGSQGAPVDGDATIYDPQTNSWSATGPMVQPRYQAEAVQLPDGRVLVAGGVPWAGQSSFTISASVELYDPAAGTWTAGAPLAQPRYAFTLAVLPGGQVLAIGGARDDLPLWTERSFIRAVERYDPSADRWSTVATLPQPIALAAAAPLADGRLWVTGGRAGPAGATYRSDTWLIQALACRTGARGPAAPAESRLWGCAPPTLP